MKNFYSKWIRPKLSEKSGPNPKKIIPDPQHWGTGGGRGVQLITGTVKSL